MVLRPQQHQQPTMTTSAAAKAPLSWKDAVKNGVAVPQPPSPQKSAPKTKPHAKSEPKPRQTTCHRAKLLRSRSVARVADAPATFRKRNDSVQSNHSNHSNSNSNSMSMNVSETKMPSDKRQQSPKHPSAALKQSHDARASASSESSRKKDAEKAARARAATAKPITSSVFASPRKAEVAVRSRDSDDARASRGRSASADHVLLRRSELPLWLLAEPSKKTANSKGTSVHFSPATAVVAPQQQEQQRVTRSRALSVPLRVEDAMRIRGESSDGRATSIVAAAGSRARSSVPSPGGRARRSESAAKHGKQSDDELSELDCEDTNSESTAESSCPSPRHSPVSGFGRAQSPADSHETLSDVLSVEEEQDFEAMMLLDRINDLSAEFLAHREYEEANALAWSVEHAARQCVISQDMAQNLHASIQMGTLDEVRDVLYHKCHLVPAVGSVVESPSLAEMNASVAQSFLDYVDELAPTDAPAARTHKLHVLKLLSDALTRWVKAVGHERGLAEEHVAITRGCLFLAGSYRLGLNDPTSDIDAVCVVPYHVTRDDFFGSFTKMLEQMDGVTQLAPVPNAYVPLISLSFLGVSMDLLFARLPMSCVEAHQEIDSDHMLVGVHAASMKSLNAPRVSSMLLCLVPKRRVFRIVLRAVRTWARRRGIYSAKLGYLGGISWAILVAFVCQMYPDAEPAKVFLRFFQVMSEWQWPQPVMLNVIYDAGLGFEMWDPRQNIYDRSHIMPIITPAYPHMNSSVQVSQSTFSVIYEEIWRARYLAEAAAGVPSSLSRGSGEMEATCGIASMGSMYSEELVTPPQAVSYDVPEVASCPWEKLFEPSNFFIRYDTYLVANFQAGTPSEMHKWGKFVMSRLRKLVDSVQHVNLVSRVHAFPSYFPHTCDGVAPGSCMFIGIEFHTRRNNNNINNNVIAAAPLLPKDDPEVKSNLEQTIRFFMATDLQQFEYKQPSMTAEARLLSWDELPEFVFPSGRAVAGDERVKYQANLEAMGFAQGTPSFRPAYYSNSYARNGRWRSGGPRKYNGGGKGKLHRFRDGPRSYPMTQAG